MSYIIKAKNREYTPAPEGLHQAVCIDVVDLGIKKTKYGDQVKIDLRWVIEEIDPKTNMQHMVHREFTPSLGKKSHLRPFLECWRGRKFTEEELKGFDIEKLLGANCQLQIAHNIGDEGDIWANVIAVVPIGKNAARMAVPPDYIRVAEREHRAELERHPDGNGNGRVQEEEYVPF
jgi:hypothetical protein